MNSVPIDRLGLALVVISSLLLGIWGVTNTIALRNSLLVIGALLALLYLVRSYRHYDEIQGSGLRTRAQQIWDWLPVGLMLAMFIWVVIHYVFFKEFADRQWDELQSTWLRTGLAVLLGFATGLAVSRNRSLTPLLWAGLFLSFLVLFAQYVPKAIAKQSFFASDYYGDYIYWAKFNGVLAGSLLAAGSLGLVIDCFRNRAWLATQLHFTTPPNEFSRLVNAFLALGIMLAIYSFVFIFDAKNGVGVVGILLVFWALCLGLFAVSKWIRERAHRSLVSLTKPVLGFVVLLGVFGWFGHLQMKINPGWESLFEDIAISAQIEKNTHWHNPSQYGYPTRANGESVRPNTYERVAWGVVGFQLIGEHPLGTGIFRALPEQMRAKQIEFTSAVYTHSAWIDLGLAFGVPGLVLMPLAFLVIFMNAARHSNKTFRASLISLALTILVLYLVGEYAFQHGIEILFFVGALLSAMAWSVERTRTG